MTGAGSGSAAWAPETSYLQGVGADPIYYGFGSNIQAETAELSRNLLAILAPDDVEARDYLAQNLGGQLSLSWLLKNDDYHRLIFNDSATGWTNGLANSAEVYLGVDYVDGITERQIKGFAPATCQVAYQGSTSAVRVTLTGAYGDEEHNTAITPGSVQRAGDEVPGHGTTLELAQSDVGDRLQSATISMEQIARLQTGASQKPIDAVQGNVQTSLDMQAIYDGPDVYERALGGASATSIQESVDQVTASLSFKAGGNTIASYNASAVAPDTYDWIDLVNNDADLNESVTFRATGITGSDPTA